MTDLAPPAAAARENEKRCGSPVLWSLSHRCRCVGAAGHVPDTRHVCACDPPPPVYRDDPDFESS